MKTQPSQMTLPLGAAYNNQSLFSDHFLTDILPTIDSAWQEDTGVVEAFQHIRDIYLPLQDVLPHLNEPQLEDKFIRPVLQCLGHVWEVQASLPSLSWAKRPDYALFPDDAAHQRGRQKVGEEFFAEAVALAEAKRWGRPLDRREMADAADSDNPAFQISQYLWLSQVSWGILTDGRFWRLYGRDVPRPRDAFYEVDLPSLLYETTPQGQEQFKYFYLFFRRQAFAPDGARVPFLQQVLDGSIEYAQEVGNKLKGNVYKALCLLANGFLKTPGNALDASRDLRLIREASLVFLYRLLFILYAERSRSPLLPVDKDVYQHNFSLRILRERVKNNLEAHRPLLDATTEYWQRLQGLFALVNQGSDALGIPRGELYVRPYNGGLFNPQASPAHLFLERHQVGDHHLARVIDLLSRSTGHNGRKEFVDYSSLEIRHLGSIYEGLLEYKLCIAEEEMVAVQQEKREVWIPAKQYQGRRPPLDRAAPDDVYAATDKGERKATGSYYTPAYIVKYIVSNTLGPILEEARKSNHNLIDTILSLKILDPAMGSGHFLVEATDTLAWALVEALGVESRGVPEDEIRWARREVVERCIYGVDLNPLAVELAKLSLWLSTVSLDKPLNFLDHHLRCGNSLIGARLEDLGQLPIGGKKAKRTAVTTLAGHRFQKAIASAVSTFQKIAEAPSESVDDIHRKESAYETARYALRRIKDIADMWTSAYFGNEIKNKDAYEHLLTLAEQDSADWSRRGKVAQLDKARAIAHERRFFHWELEFPEVFFDRKGQCLENPGFSAVAGNPPYDVLEKERLGLENPHQELAEYLELMPAYYPSLGGKVNLFRPFMVQESRLLRPGGALGTIVPLAIANDYSCTRTRSALLKDTRLVQLVCFPQKDDPSDRVFEDAKLSTCIPILRKPGPTTEFIVQVHPGRQLSNNPKQVRVALAQMEAVDPDVLPIPLATQIEWELAVRLHTRLPTCRISDLATLTRGEVNQTVYSRFITSNQFHNEMVKGPEIDRYGEHLYLSQGEKQWFDEDAYYKETKNPKAIPAWRIATQRITGIDDSIRLIAAFLDRRAYLADSTNSIAHGDVVRLNFLLSLINSRFFNWRFKLTSTNSNVPTNELDRLPVRRINFTTPKTGRERLMKQGKELQEEYLQSKDWRLVLSFVDERLHQKPDGSPDTEREQSDVVHDLLAFMAEEMTRLHKEKQSEVKGFVTWLESYLGVNVEDMKNKTKVKVYWKGDVGWEGFLSALEQNRRAILSAKGVVVSRREPQEAMRVEFEASVAKLRPLLERIELTDRLIDQIVYKLYGLTEEEIAVVEGTA